MLRRHCKTCGNPLHTDDTHTEYVSRLGKSQLRSAGLIARTASVSVLPLCAHGQLSFQRATPPLTPSCFLSPRYLWEKTAGRGFLRPMTSELMSAQCPHASPSPQRERESILLSSSLNMISVPPPWATWSRLVRVTVKKNTAFFSGGFGRGRVFGLCDWPRPLNIVLFT